VSGYNVSDFTWGYELELGDIPRGYKIPEQLGTWEYAETDILNLHGEAAYKAVDPLGLEPNMGGEINVKPTKSWQEQVDRVFEIIDMFKQDGHSPSASCVNHGHLHVFVPGLKQDIDGLKRLTKYIKENQHEAITSCYGFRENYLMKETKTAKQYLKWDGGRPMPDWMCENIIEKAESFEDFIRLHAAGKDGVSMGRPFRFAINTYCMKHIGTIEFRLFRGTIVRKEIEDSFKFAEKFIDSALNSGPSVRDILLEGNYQFPRFYYDHKEYQAWEKTKYDKSRGKKERNFYEV